MARVLDTEGFRLLQPFEDRIARTAQSNDGSRRLINYFVGQVVGQLGFRQAEAAGTISYELLTALGDRVPRRYCAG